MDELNIEQSQFFLEFMYTGDHKKDDPRLKKVTMHERSAILNAVYDQAQCHFKAGQKFMHTKATKDEDTKATKDEKEADAKARKNEVKLNEEAIDKDHAICCKCLAKAIITRENTTKYGIYIPMGCCGKKWTIEIVSGFFVSLLSYYFVSA